MRIWGYLKTSQDRQDILQQKQVILAFAEKEKIFVSRFIEFPISSTTNKEKRIDLLLGQLEPKDTLIVSNLSRIGWSLREIVQTVNALVKADIRLIAVKEGIHLNQENDDLQLQSMVRMFSLLAEMEHDLISQRTREALAVAKAKGRLGGRPPALNPQQRELAVKLYREKRKSVAEICQMMGISRQTFYNYLKRVKPKD